MTTEGANLLADKKVTLSANAVTLSAASSSGTSTHNAQRKSLTVGAELTGTVGSLITRAYDMAKEAEYTEDSRLQDALRLKAGYDAYKLVTNGALDNGIASLSDVGTGGDPAGAAFGVSVSVQSSSQRSRSAEAYTQQRGTNIQGGSIDIKARESDITMQGAKLQAQDISLEAKRDIHLLAAANSAVTASQNSGKSMGGGVTVGFGSQNGISFQANAGTSKGRANGNELSYDNTLVTATESLNIKSGGDVNMIGAQVAGKSVAADIGGDLNIQSLQDATHYASKQSSSGLFESALGFTRSNADDLMMQLRQGVMSNPAVAGKVDQFGARFTVDIPVTGPAGSGVVRSGWIYRQGSDTPELTTIFVK